MKVISSTTLVTGAGKQREQHPPGTPVDLEKGEAQDLIARGLAEPVGRARRPEEPIEDDLADVKKAILELDTEKPELFEEDGRPKAAALSEALRRRVTKKERDTAWEALQA